MLALELSLTKRGLGDDTAAELLGISRSQLSKIRRGKSRPSLEIAVAIEREFGVPCRDWIMPPESQPSGDMPTEIEGRFVGQPAGEKAVAQ